MTLSDYWYQYALMSTSSTSNSTLVYNDNTTVTNDTVTYRAVQTIDGVRAVPMVVGTGKPEKITLEGAARPEDHIAWLKRRVQEVSWSPS